MIENIPIKVWFEQSASQTLRDIMLNSTHFDIQAEPGTAELIIYETDLPHYIRDTPTYKTYPEKCVVVSETDLPSYFLPACYASNKKSYLGKNRSITIPFLASQYHGSNPFIEYKPTSADNRFLYSFRGGSTSWVRKRLFKLKFDKTDVLIQNSSNYHHWNGEAGYLNEKRTQQQEYAKLLEESTFFLCPRGAGSSSIRLFEVMQAGKVPVIFADNWIPVPGMDWNLFSVFIPENKLSEIDAVVRSNTAKATSMGVAARKAWEQYCAPPVAAATLASSLRYLIAQRNDQREKWIHTIFPFFGMTTAIWEKGRGIAKKMILKFFAVTGLKFSYELNRPIEEQLKKKN